MFQSQLCVHHPFQFCEQISTYVIPFIHVELPISLFTNIFGILMYVGVNTTDILTQYISSIRALRVLDPSGIVLELVCEPIRKYLRYLIMSLLHQIMNG